MARIDELLKMMSERQASDLHMTTGMRPYIRESGDMMPVEEASPLTAADNREMLYEIMPPDNRREFEARRDTDFAYEVPDVARFRVNIFVDRFGMGAVLRRIPTRILTADDLGLPDVVREFCYLTKGLVVVTGPTGSGKSTTLAAMIDLINKTRSDHIVTIEDPIEFTHTSQKCLVNQREVHAHTESFAAALRAALREDPDIVLVGEMRDLETMEIAIETAETGHLVFGTLHTNTAATTVNRIIDKFPSNRQNQIRTMLADSLRGVVAQTLCKRIPKGRVAAMEVLVVTSAVSSNIREGKTHMIPSAMQIGKSVGMRLYNDSLMELVLSGLITPKEAYMKAVDKEPIAKAIATAGLKIDLEATDERPLEAAKPEETLEGLIAAWIEELRRNPDDTQALNNLAWALATSADPRLRNAAEAVRTAERALQLTGGHNPAVLDTLGAAYAEAGRFDKALESARKGLKMARATGQTPLADALALRIRLYEAGQAHRQE